MSVYLFPGQGSQAIGMGKELFEQFPEYVQKADAILGYSIAELCLTGPEDRLNQTQYTQPALYVVNALTLYAKRLQNLAPPTFVAGHSLGEYNALLAADVFDFETGLRLVQKRGALMSLATEGGMAAIIGLPAETIQTILDTETPQEVVIANDNSYTQLVISGKKSAVEFVLPLLKAAGATLVIPLKVSGAFHSPLMISAEQEFADFLKSFTFAKPRIPVIANVTGNPYEADHIAQNLSAQISHAVKWTASIQYLLDQGETEFEEIGPGKVLAGLVKRIKNKN